MNTPSTATPHDDLSSDEWMEGWEALCHKIETACVEKDYTGLPGLVALRQPWLDALLQGNISLSYELKDRLSRSEVAIQARMAEHHEMLRKQMGHTRRMVVGLRKYTSC